MVIIPKTFKENILHFYQRQQTLVSILTFSVGFLVDVITFKRVYTANGLILQALYLLVLGFLISFEIKVCSGEIHLSDKRKKWWSVHNLFIHFLFGSLLSLYTIFYYNSASAFTSLLFILLLAGLMLANELNRFREIGLPIRVILFSICSLSFFSFLYPLLLGKIGPLPFWLGILSSMILLSLIWFFNLSGLKKIRNSILLHAAGVHLFFIIAYTTSLIPPVPVALKKIGIFHHIEKVDGKYIGKYHPHERNFWSFNSTFLARRGDKIHVLLSIFSPDSFRDHVYLKWYHFNENKRWSLEDSIPLSIIGGREAGFRGFGTKQVYSEGSWKIIVETSDGREVGRIKFEIKPDSSTSDRLFLEDIF